MGLGLPASSLQAQGLNQKGFRALRAAKSIPQEEAEIPQPEPQLMPQTLLTAGMLIQHGSSTVRQSCYTWFVQLDEPATFSWPNLPQG